MNRPSRQTTAGRVYLDLRALARRQGRPTDEILILFVFERFRAQHGIGIRWRVYEN